MINYNLYSMYIFFYSKYTMTVLLQSNPSLNPSPKTIKFMNPSKVKRHNPKVQVLNWLPPAAWPQESVG